MGQGTQEYTVDTRNKDILININGELFPHDEAEVSDFDNGYILRDGVWEGLRVHNGSIAFLEEHLNRLYDTSKGTNNDR